MRDRILAIFQRHLPNKLKPSGRDNYTTTCPFHKGGEEKTPSFSVNVEKGVFHCFTCHEAGSLKKLLKKVGLTREQIDSATQGVADILQRNVEQAERKKKNLFSISDPFEAKPILEESILGIFDNEPTTLIQDGFDPRLLKEMDIGFDSRAQRVTYPLRDLYGNLAGISGGAISKGVQPKYKVYQGGKTVNGRFLVGDFGEGFDEMHPNYVCENHNFLWNFDNVYPRVVSASDPKARVFIVEGFKACLWMQMAGFWNTVALMGSYISEIQQRMIHRFGCPIVLFLDNDQPGREATLNVGERLWLPMRSKVQVMRYPEADVLAAVQDETQKTQPDDYELDALRTLAENTISYSEHFHQTRRSTQCR
jgi:DNA primase